MAGEEKKLNKRRIVDEFDLFAKAKKTNVLYFLCALGFAFGGIGFLLGRWIRSWSLIDLGNT